MAELSKELPIYCSFLKHLCCKMSFVSVEGTEQCDLGPHCQAEKGPCTSLDPFWPQVQLGRASRCQSQAELGWPGAGMRKIPHGWDLLMLRGAVSRAKPCSLRRGADAGGVSSTPGVPRQAQ